jgi:mRNA-degrading endonuclease toxin of MazEF toxin-antitoxin module
MKRGDVILVRFPHPSGQRGKKGPAVVIQSDIQTSTIYAFTI